MLIVGWGAVSNGRGRGRAGEWGWDCRRRMDNGARQAQMMMEAKLESTGNELAKD